MKAPAFQFYARDFRASLSVTIMNSAQRGGYIMLLAAAWDFEQPGYLPNDDDLLRLFSGMTEDEWAAGRDRILKQFPVTEDASLRFNARLLSEVEKQANYRESRAKGGKAAAEKRAAAQHNGSSKSAYAEPNPAHAEPSASIAPTLLSASATASTNKEKLASSAGQDLASPIESADAPQRPTGRPKLYRYDNAPVFLITEFFAYLRQQGYGHVDMPMYLQRIQEGARKGVHDTRKLKEEATNDEWKAFILRWLDGDKANKRLLLPDELPRPVGGGYGGPNPALQVTTTTANYGPDRIAAQATKVFY